MANDKNTIKNIKEEIQVSSLARKVFKKLGVITLEDACQIEIEQLRNLVKSKAQNQVYVDELWEYVHENGCSLKDEEAYLKKLKNIALDFPNIAISDFFMSVNARKFMAGYGTITGFLSALKNSSSLLKSFLCLVIVYEKDDNLEKIFKGFGNDGLVLDIIIQDFKDNVKKQGTLMPVYMVFSDKRIYNNLIRNDCWLLSDLINLSAEQITKIPRLGEIKAKRIIMTLHDMGFSLDSKYPSLRLSLEYVETKRLNLSPEILTKLEEMQITNLEQLINLGDFHSFNDEELSQIRKEILKLNFQLLDKTIAMPNEILEARYNKLLEERNTLSLQMERVNKETCKYQRILNLTKEEK